jgi:hypothetical protein
LYQGVAPLISGITPTNDLSNLQIVAFHRSGFCDTEDLAVNHN